MRRGTGPRAVGAVVVCAASAAALLACNEPTTFRDPRQIARDRAEWAIDSPVVIAASSVILRECDIEPGFQSTDRGLVEVALGGVWQPERLEPIESHLGVGVFSRSLTRLTGVDDATRLFARSAPFMVHLNRVAITAAHPIVTCDGKELQGRLWFHAELDESEVLDALELDDTGLKARLNDDLPEEGAQLTERDLLHELDALPPAP